MPVISLIAFGIFLFLLVDGLKKNSDFFSPARVFSFIWLIAIALVEFKFSRLQIEWSLFGWFILLIGIVFFLLGNYVAFVQNFNMPKLEISEIRERIRLADINEPLFFKLIIIYAVIFVVSFLTEYFIEGYVPLFTAQPDKARKMFGIFGLHLIVNGVNVLLFLIFQYFVLIKNKPVKKSFLSVIFVVSTGSFFLLLQRYNFFILSVMIVCFLYYSGKKINYKTFIVAAVVIVGLVFLIRSVRIAQFAEYYFFVTSEMKFSPKYALLSEPYMYIAMNLENFVANFNKIQNHTYGFFTADFLTALTGVKHIIAEYAGLEKFPHYIGGYNTFPFYWVYYYDFGMFGLAVFPFLLGYVISHIYFKLRRSLNLPILVLYSVAFSVIAISYSSDPLTRLDMVFNYSVTVLSQFIILRKTEIA